MLKKKAAALSAFGVGILTLAVVGATSTSANADPIHTANYAAVGSDTIQALYDGFGNGYLKGSPGVLQAATPSPNGTPIASYDAFEPGVSAINVIQTKVGGSFFNRPTGSGAGVIALSASNHTPFLAPFGASTANIQGQVDIARSSAKPANPVTAGGTTDHLSFIPLARDAVSVAVNSSNVNLTSFTEPELNAIFTCSTLGTGTNVGDIVIPSGQTDPAIVTAAGNVQLHPKLPQSASGTLAFFLGAVGMTLAGEGACVDTTSSVAGSPTNTLQENTASELTNTGDIAPFSAAQWIAQKNGIAPSTFSPASANLAIKSITIGGTPSAPVAGTTTLTPGALFGSPSTAPLGGVGDFNRDVYSVITTANFTAGGDLATLVKTTLPGKTTVIRDFGFLPLSYTGTTGQFHSDWTN